MEDKDVIVGIDAHTRYLAEDESLREFGPAVNHLVCRWGIKSQE